MYVEKIEIGSAFITVHGWLFRRGKAMVFITIGFPDQISKNGPNYQLDWDLVVFVGAIYHPVI